MFSFKRSLIALVGVLAIAGALSTLMPLVSRGQGGNPFNRDPRRSFYLTQTTHTGSQALSACAAGYHMTSLWEIFDSSNLRYNTELGLTTDDSGSGPPTAAIFGWVRTGGNSNSVTEIAGISNCNVWTTSDSQARGTLVRLPLGWDNPVGEGRINPWDPGWDHCSSPHRVWCVQD